MGIFAGTTSGGCVICRMWPVRPTASATTGGNMLLIPTVSKQLLGEFGQDSEASVAGCQLLNTVHEGLKRFAVFSHLQQ